MGVVEHLGQSASFCLLRVALLPLRCLFESDLGGLRELNGVALQPRRDGGLDGLAGAVGAVGSASSAVFGNGSYCRPVHFSTDYLDAVLSRTVEQLRTDLEAQGFPLPSVEGSVEGRTFLFDMTKGGERRFWRYVVDEPMYAYVPDGSDPESHSLWLATLLAEENTTMLHRQ